jgi:hypothetical protein
MSSIGTAHRFLNTCRVQIHWHPDALLHDTGSGLFDTPDPGWLEARVVPSSLTVLGRAARGAWAAVAGTGPRAQRIAVRPARPGRADVL